jgi:hypothetical protein
MSRYRRDLEAARGRLATREHHSIQTPYGSVQYAERGQALHCYSATPWSAVSTWAWGVPSPGSGIASG